MIASLHSESALARTSHAAHHRRDGSCEPADPADTVTDRLNNLLAHGGDGYTLSLCPSAHYLITAPVLFAAPNQEISTLGYPTDDTRATLVVNGVVQDGSGHTTAVDGTCATCGGVKLRNIQVNGTRGGAPPTNGGGNIEMGGSNSNQLVEGAFSCNNITIQNNDIGPAGSSAFQQWADGISVSCQNAIVRNNLVNNPTDGGIVVFGSPGSQITNNTIWIETQTLLGGINMVDYDPWRGNYTGTVVADNTIIGEFSDEKPQAGQKDGTNSNQIMIKIGIAVGPRTWFGDQYGWDLNQNGTIRDNRLTGAFGYAMAVGSAAGFTIQGNTLFGNTSFIGANGPNCTTTEAMPVPAAFVFDANNTSGMVVQPEFVSIPTADGLTCVMPPSNGDFWPFGGNPAGSPGGPGGPSSSSPTSQSPLSPASSSSALSGGAKAGIAIGVLAAVAGSAALLYFVRRWALRRSEARQQVDASSRPAGWDRTMEQLPSDS